MRKEAFTYCVAVVITGAFGLLLRWLQCSMIFKEGSDLAVAGAPVSYLMSIVIVLIPLFLWRLSRSTGMAKATREPDAALARPHMAVSALLGVAALVAALGAVLLFFQADSLSLKAAALLGLLAAPVLMLYPSLPNWGGVGAAFSLVPVAFYAVWMIVIYKENVVNPVLWSFAVQILAVAAGLYALFHLSGYLFFSAKPRKALFACGLAAVYGMIALGDSSMLSVKLLLGSWSVALAVLCWVLVSNIPETEEE